MLLALHARVPAAFRVAVTVAVAFLHATVNGSSAGFLVHGVAFVAVAEIAGAVSSLTAQFLLVFFLVFLQFTGQFSFA